MAVVSLWLGFVRTERNEPLFHHPRALEGPYGPFIKNYETPQFIGNTIVALHRDPERVVTSGPVQILAELAEVYGITEADGRQPASNRGRLGGPAEPSDVVV